MARVRASGRGRGSATAGGGERRGTSAFDQPQPLTAEQLALQEAERERQFTSAEREKAFTRAKGFFRDIFGGDMGGEPFQIAAGGPRPGAPGGVPGAAGPAPTGMRRGRRDQLRSDAFTALERSIEERGEAAQGRLSSDLARRGIFRGGPSAAAAARLRGETEAQVAKARAGFVESASERRSRERIASEQARANIFGSLMQTVGAFA